MRPSSLLAVAVSAVLGVALGIGAGLALDRSPTAFADPLGLNIPFQNQPCNNPHALLTVGRGDRVSELGSAVAENLPDPLSYLSTANSCRTFWKGPNQPAPEYVVYRGPYDTSAQACGAQFAAGRRGGVVTVLKDGTSGAVKCLCVVQTARPTMRSGMSTEGTSGIWIRQLQNLLVAIGRGSPEDVTGSYDVSTATRIRAFQTDNDRPATGEVDPDTWHALLHEYC